MTNHTEVERIFSEYKRGKEAHKEKGMPMEEEITTDEQYQKALDRFMNLMDNGTQEELEALGAEIEKWEDKWYPVEI